MQMLNPKDPNVFPGDDVHEMTELRFDTYGDHEEGQAPEPNSSHHHLEGPRDPYDVEHNPRTNQNYTSGKN